MKTLIICLVFALVAGVSRAQKITELKEAKVGFAPLSSEVVRDGNSYAFNVKESYAGEFETNPIAFMEAYFDIQNFIDEVKHENYDSYQVTFSSKKGRLKADFDKEGNLEATSERFKNILLPASLREQLYRDHKGWAMVKNVRVSRGESGVIDTEFYRIKLRNGDKRKILKIDGIAAERNEVVSN